MIEFLPIESIIPYPQNNRLHSDQQIQRIGDSIKQFGFNQPVVIDENNIVLVGHGRLFAAQKLELKEIPVIVKSDLTETQKRAYRILDNKLQNDSTWDFANLESELDILKDEDFDLKAWGLDDLRAMFPEEEIEVREDDGPGSLPTDDDTFIKLGDVIELNQHRLVCGNCTDTYHTDLVSTGKTFDIVITDPPYGVSYKGKTKDALEIENDDLDEDALSSMWNSCLDFCLANLKEGGVIYATVPAVPLRQVFAQPLKDRGVLRQELIWLKDCMVMGRSDYHYKHEPILYGWKPGAAHYMTSDRSKTSVLEHARPKRSAEHPTMKPLSLWGDLIGNSSKRNELVLDPFLGSGTTLIACEQLSRTCYGMEISPKYCHVIVERYKKYCADNKKPCTVKINGEVL